MQHESARPYPPFELLTDEFSGTAGSWPAALHSLWTELWQGVQQRIETHLASRNTVDTLGQPSIKLLRDVPQPGALHAKAQPRRDALQAQCITLLQHHR